jgi:hypothetical protein
LDRKKVLEADADFFAIRNLARQKLSGLLAGGSEEYVKNRFHEEVAEIGSSLALLLLIISPNHPSISEYDRADYSHPQVRLLYFCQGLGEEARRLLGGKVKVPVNELIQTFNNAAAASTYSIYGVLSDYLAKEGELLKNEYFRSPVLFMFRPLAMHMVFDRAKAIVAEMRAHLDVSGEFQWQEVHELPRSCRVSSLEFWWPSGGGLT